MEKPRKKEVYIPTDEQVGNGAYYDLRELEGYNKGLDAMSTWLVGQVPTEEQTELEIHRYFDKGLKSDKPTNITIEFLARHLHERLIRKLTGKV